MKRLFAGFLTNVGRYEVERGRIAGCEEEERTNDFSPTTRKHEQTSRFPPEK